MRLGTIFACVLATCGPLFVAGQKKMIFVIPRTLQRTHSSSWSQFTRLPFTKVTKLPEKEFLSSQRSHPSVNPKFTKGKPYYFIQNPPLMDAPGPLEHTENNDLNYHPHPQVTQQMDNYLHRDEEPHHHDDLEGIQERTTDNQITLEKPFNFIYKILKKPYFSPESLSNKDKSILTDNKEGLVLRDSIDLNHYHKKLMELASTWPGDLHTSPGSALSTAVSHGNIPEIEATSQQLSGLFQPNDFGGFNFLSSNPLISQQGYAVQEDVQEEIPHDFRTQPIQIAPAPNPQDILQVGVPQTNYGIPSASFMSSLQFPALLEFQVVSRQLQG